MFADFVIVGGGISGVSCTETLAFLQPEKIIILLSDSALIKTVTNLYAITKTISQFDVKEQPSDILTQKYQNVTVIHDELTEVDDIHKRVTTKGGKTIHFSYLCLCIGAEPKLISEYSKFPEYIVGIRDTDSVQAFITKLNKCKKVVIVGNGGIASEIVYKIKNAEIDWVIKDKHISATFVDPGAAEFFQDSLHNNISEQGIVSKRMRYKEDEFNKCGAALGPDWYKNLIISGANCEVNKKVTIHYESEITMVSKTSDLHYLRVNLSNGKVISCDLIVSATGVTPRKNFGTISALDISEDGGIKVDEYMRTNLNNIYAAGDFCTSSWPWAKHWFPMKLWTQARQMGCYAAKCMSSHMNNEEILQDFCFEIFAHSTKLFGYKVILLGLYNGQKLDGKYEILLRTTPKQEYIKFIIEDNKLQGAVLIGDTDLEEMCENLILNQISLEPYGDDILNPDIDIEDYFD
ncbi:hypothetical protein GWI33_020320 [Rhynchophorus ferrugineus]|uniref:Pyridine nucleotide-disulfide oxidoreductase domain-containing protein 1 n=1 Tax=Rhynchophorus ferrugineus TaxID=354439 RepID=A0A834HR91_RHYFE|nr:hypothetical protein GWI33_020320 [Rhynchophorus ferrugineus]